MSTNNDSRILALQEGIRKEREAIASVERFVPVTTCIFQFQNYKINLHTLDMEHLTLIHLLLRTFIKEAESLGYLKSKIGGFTLEEWEHDVLGVMTKYNVRRRKQLLEQQEKKLAALLSEDKRTELELDAIEEMLNGEC